MCISLCAHLCLSWCVYLYFCVCVVCLCVCVFIYIFVYVWFVYIYIYICMCVYVSVCLCVCVYFERIIWTRRRYASEKKRQMPGEMESEGLFFLRGESIIIQNILMYDFTTYIYIHSLIIQTESKETQFAHHQTFSYNIRNRENL